MHPVLALFAPDRAIERRERQACRPVHRPGNGDPIHPVMATNFEVLFFGWIANPTEGHLRTGNRVATANLDLGVILIITHFANIPPSLPHHPFTVYYCNDALTIR